MSALLHSLRRKLFGETRTIPLGVAAAILIALLMQALLPRSAWQSSGGFAFAAVLIATLLRSLHPKTTRRHQ
jgi:hypothetical protein